jgi:glycerol uptake facilitator-like aquaporin
MFGRRKIATLVAEFLGTGVLTLLILSVQRSTIGIPFFVALAAGLTLAMAVFTLGAYTTGYFNPAITLGFWTTRRLETLTAVLYIAVQLLGAWGAYYLYTYFVKNGLQPVGGHFSWRVFTAEAVATGIFALGVAAASLRRLSPAVTASFAGLSYVVGIIAASSASIGLLNPAVALGVRAWVWGTYVLGPVVGALIAINLYDRLFAPVALETAAAGAVESAAVTANGSRSTRATTAARPKRATAKKTTAKRRTTRR